MTQHWAACQEDNQMNGGVVRWGVAQIYSKRADRIREELKKMNRGTFTPVCIKRRFVDGQQVSKQVDLLPTYIFFEVNDEAWGPIGQIEGVLRVMGDGRAQKDI